MTVLSFYIVFASICWAPASAVGVESNNCDTIPMILIELSEKS